MIKPNLNNHVLFYKYFGKSFSLSFPCAAVQKC